MPLAPSPTVALCASVGAPRRWSKLLGARAPLWGRGFAPHLAAGLGALRLLDASSRRPPPDPRPWASGAAAGRLAPASPVPQLHARSVAGAEDAVEGWASQGRVRRPQPALARDRASTRRSAPLTRPARPHARCLGAGAVPLHPWHAPSGSPSHREGAGGMGLAGDALHRRCIRA